MTYEEFKQMHLLPKTSRKGMPVSHEEDELQMACIEWFKVEAYPDLAPLMFHPNNEPYFGRGLSEDAKIRTGARMKRMGVTAGVADIILLHKGFGSDGTECPALCIEMKARSGRQSNAQKAWQQKVQQAGYRYEVARSIAEFKQLIQQYLAIPPREPDREALIRILNNHL